MHTELPCPPPSTGHEAPVPTSLAYCCPRPSHSCWCAHEPFAHLSTPLPGAPVCSSLELWPGKDFGFFVLGGTQQSVKYPPHFTKSSLPLSSPGLCIQQLLVHRGILTKPPEEQQGSKIGRLLALGHRLSRQTTLPRPFPSLPPHQHPSSSLLLRFSLGYH